MTIKSSLAALAVVGFAATGLCDVSSANVVGYSGKPLQFGYTTMTAQFVGVGDTEAEGEIDLQDIKANDAASDLILLSKLDNLGVTIESYLWVNWYEDEEGNVVPCWMDEGCDHKIEGVKFYPGEGFAVKGDDDSQIVTTSGQVCTKDVDVELQFGYTTVGAPVPVAIDLQDITANDASSDLVLFSKLDYLGVTTENYLWVNWYEDEEGNVVPCWMDEGCDHKIEGVTIDAGEAVSFKGDDNSQVVTFPGVELK